MPFAGAAAGGERAGGGGGAGPRRLSKTVIKLASIDEQIKRKTFDQVDSVEWIRTDKADIFFGVVIFLNTAFIGIDIEVSDYAGGFPSILWVVETIFLLIFVIEILLRIRAERPHYMRYFDAWGVFDFAVTVLGCLDAWIVTPVFAIQGSNEENPLSSFTVLRVFRLLRLVRLLRVLRMFSELVVLVQTIGNSLKAVAWMSVLLGMIMYTGSVITVLTLGQPHGDDPEIAKHFGSLGTALFSHFCIVTLEGWPEIANSALTVHSLWAVYFVFVIILTNFALVNLMVGVIVERIINFSVEQEQALESFVAESDQFRMTLQTLFDSASLDHSGVVTREEVRTLLDLPHTHEIFQAVGINPNIPPSTLHTIMDLNRDGPTNFQEFFDACLRLCGSKNSIHSVFVQGDICEAQHTLNKRLGSLEADIQVLSEQMRGASGSPGTNVRNRNVSDKALPAGAEAAVHHLLERMDRFGQVQQQISAEMFALRELAGERGAASRSAFSANSGGSVLEGCYNPTNQPVPVLPEPSVLNNVGRELAAGCCVDSMFAPAEAQHGRPPPPVGGLDPSFKSKVRKDLEAEFLSKQAAKSPGISSQT